MMCARKSYLKLAAYEYYIDSREQSEEDMLLCGYDTGDLLFGVLTRSITVCKTNKRACPAQIIRLITRYLILAGIYQGVNKEIIFNLIYFVNGKA